MNIIHDEYYSLAKNIVFGKIKPNIKESNGTRSKDGIKTSLDKYPIFTVRT